MRSKEVLSILLVMVCVGCAGRTQPMHHENPAMDYTRKLEQEKYSQYPEVQFVGAPGPDDRRRKVDPPRLRMKDSSMAEAAQDMAYNGRNFRAPSYSPSLFRESHGQPGFVRDFRAWKPMDLVTILVSEVAQAAQNADTQVDSTSTIQAAISRFLGIETSIADRNTQILPTALVETTSNSQFDGQGITRRSDNLIGTISAMVQEVLPSGVLRIEGKKIISVNNEQHTMVISGLIRPQDINSLNQVQSGSVANMRIDYYGNGVVSDVQAPGILTRLFNKLWPF